MSEYGTSKSSLGLTIRTIRVSEVRAPMLERWGQRVMELQDDRDALLDALYHCGYDPDDCIDCGGPPHNEWCRFWKLRHILSYWEETDD